MNDRTAYTGIDEFRLAAALLVITIHTSPLASCSETGDFPDSGHSPRGSAFFSDGIGIFPDLSIRP